MDAAADAVLTKLSTYVLDPDIVEGAIADAVQELQPSRDTVNAKRQVLTDQIRKVEDEQAKYIAAIAVAGQVDALARALQEREQQRALLQRELVMLESADRLSTFDPQRIEGDLRRRLTEWRQLLRRQMPLSRQVISELLDGRIAWTPHKDEGLCEFTGRVKFDQLLSGLVVTQGMASPTGSDGLYAVQAVEWFAA